MSNPNVKFGTLCCHAGDFDREVLVVVQPTSEDLVLKPAGDQILCYLERDNKRYWWDLQDLIVL